MKEEDFKKWGTDNLLRQLVREFEDEKVKIEANRIEIEKIKKKLPV